VQKPLTQDWCASTQHRWTDGVLFSSRSGILFTECANYLSMQFGNYIHFGLRSLQSFFERPRTKCTYVCGQVMEKCQKCDTEPNLICITKHLGSQSVALCPWNLHTVYFEYRQKYGDLDRPTLHKLVYWTSCSYTQLQRTSIKMWSHCQICYVIKQVRSLPGSSCYKNVAQRF